MLFTDYKDQVLTDALEQIELGEYDYCSDAEQVTENMWTDDSITGNGSGSYTFSTWKAQENVSDLIWDEEFREELDSVCIRLSDLVDDGPEAMDVTARCLALCYVSAEIEKAWNDRHDSEEPEEDQDDDC